MSTADSMHCPSAPSPDAATDLRDGARRAHHWIDGHLDLAMLGVNGRDMRSAVPADAPHALTLPALREGRVRVALGTTTLWHAPRL